MEVILEKADGIPQNAILSMKIGGTRRQATASSIGQSFRFGVSPAEPLPLQVELFAPIAAPQMVRFTPEEDCMRIQLNDKMSVSLKQRACLESQPSAPTGAEVAQSRGLTGDGKQAAAKSAAAYMDTHGLVRTFQDIIHGLLVSKPDDPWAYLEEHVARAKAFAKKDAPPSAPSKEVEKAPPPPQMKSAPAPQEKSAPPPQMKSAPPPQMENPSPPAKATMKAVVKAKMTVQGVDYEGLSKNPSMLADFKSSVTKAIAKDAGVGEADVQLKLSSGSVKVDATITPPVGHDVGGLQKKMAGSSTLTNSVASAASGVQGIDSVCKAPISVDAMEVTEDVQEELRPPGRRGSIQAGQEAARPTTDISPADFDFNKFIEMLEEDKEKICEVVPFLPDWLYSELTSDDFLDSAEAQFAALDKDNSGSLEPGELISLIAELSNAHPTTIDLDKCKRFVKVFDVHEDGVIRGDEFIEFAQFILVMNYLSAQGPNGDKPKYDKRGSISTGRDALDIKTSEKSFGDFIQALEADRDAICEIVPFLPDWLYELLSSDEFMDDCEAQFRALDVDSSGSLEPDELLPIIAGMCQQHPMDIDIAKCKKFATIFDVNGDGVIKEDEFIDLAQFLMVMSFLEGGVSEEAVKPNKRGSIQQMERIEKKQPEVNFTDFINMLEQDREMISEIVPYLPDWLYELLVSDEFLDSCEANFRQLDADGSGALEPAELLPVIVELCKDHPMQIDLERCVVFAKVFDVNGDGVIKEDEFIDLAQFLMVMNYLNSADPTDTGSVSSETRRRGRIQPGRDGSQDGKKADKTFNEFLQMLEADRDAIVEIVPYLPDWLYDFIVSDEFLDNCDEQFAALDVDCSGSLEPDELLPIIAGMCDSHPMNIDLDKCRKFAKIFDSNGDGVIKSDEFIELAQFMMVLSHLESEEANGPSKRGLVHQGRTEHKNADQKFSDFLVMLEADRNAMAEVTPYLPDWLYNELCSNEFLDECDKKFLDLDADGSGVLEPDELVPVIAHMFHAHPVDIDIDKCKRFVKIFDIKNDGVIRQDEFVDFAQFLAVMNFLSQNSDEAEAGGRTKHGGIKKPTQSKVDSLLDMLHKGKKNLNIVLPFIPQELRDSLSSQTFVDECKQNFADLDKTNQGELSSEDLIPVVVEFAMANGHDITSEDAIKFAAFFDQDGNGKIDMGEFYELVQFVLLCFYLETDDGRNVVETATAEESHFNQFLDMLEHDRQRLEEVIPMLPEELIEQITSDVFLEECEAAFAALDADNSGVLEPDELVPIIMNMSEAKSNQGISNLDEDKCKRFLKIFDANGDGVIQADELVELCQYLMVMNFLSSRDMDDMSSKKSSSPGHSPSQRNGAPPPIELDSHSHQSQPVPTSPAMGHLKVDADFYKSKSHKLADENEALRRRMLQMEEALRRAESQMEDKEMELRHAQVELMSTKQR
jgi:Ca2+-binding EF-hand superfamily protein